MKKNIKPIENISQYKGQIPFDVAQKLGMDIEDVLHALHDNGYYFCRDCLTIVDVEQLGNGLNESCDKCRELGPKITSITVMGE